MAELAAWAAEGTFYTYAKAQHGIAETWQVEYAHPDGMSRSAFYRYYQAHRPVETTMPMAHKAGEKFFVDYSGDGLAYIHRQTGEEVGVEFFIGCLGASSFSYAEASPSQGIRVFDYAKQFAEPLRDEIVNTAERLAQEHGLTIEFIRKSGAFRKEDRIQAILAERGTHPGLVHFFSALETCSASTPWHDKATDHTGLRGKTTKCLHYDFYFIDAEFGLCYLRVTGPNETQEVSYSFQCLSAFIPRSDEKAIKRETTLHVSMPVDISFQYNPQCPGNRRRRFCFNAYRHSSISATRTGYASTICWWRFQCLSAFHYQCNAVRLLAGRVKGSGFNACRHSTTSATYPVNALAQAIEFQCLSAFHYQCNQGTAERRKRRCVFQCLSAFHYQCNDSDELFLSDVVEFQCLSAFHYQCNGHHKHAGKG